MGADTTASTATANAPPTTTTIPPRRRLALRRPPDRNRPFEILSILLVYIVAVHFLLKFASFFLLDDEGINGVVVPPSREELLGLRGAKGVLGFSLEASFLRGRTRWDDGVTARDNCGSVFSSNLWSCEERDGRGRISSSDRISGRYSGITTAHSFSESLREDSTIEITKEEFNINNDQNVNITNTKSTQPTEKTTKPKKKRTNRPRIPILSYQNDHVIVSKPPGMTMHHNSNTRWGRSKGPVLQTTIHKQLSRKPYLVHRLDHRTSGAVIMGFDSRTAGELHGRLREKDATKLYVALVRGDLRERFQCAAAAMASPVVSEDDGDCWNYPDSVDMSANCDGSIVGSFERMPEIMTGGGGKEHLPPHCNENAGSEHNVKISVNLPIKANDMEKEAQTDFYFLSSTDAPEKEDCTVKPDGNTNNAAATPYVTKSLTLLLCRPRTGRIHQIRRHTQKAFRAPIIGDSEHGDSRVNRFWRETTGLDRLGLHCWYLGLPPSSSSLRSDADRDNDGDDDGEKDGSIECIAPLTDDFAKALRHEALRPLWEEAVRVEPRLEMEPYDERGGSFGRYYRERIRDDDEE